ncbi:MAG: hypothetical protein ABSG64_12510 [Solirubrobacteraceae bacterium]|jgi:hypothetical protein
MISFARFKQLKQARLMAAVAGLCIVVSGGSVALGAGAAGSAPTAYPASVPLASAVDTADANTFAVLDVGVGSQDAVPATETEGLAAGGFTQMFGGNLSLARQATGFQAGGAWVVPGDGAVCLIADPKYGTADQPDGAAMCSADAGAAGGYLEFTTGTLGTDTSVAGLVPNGVGSVQLQLADGSLETLPVHDNVYMSTLSENLSAVTFVLPTGQTVDLTS